MHRARWRLERVHGVFGQMWAGVGDVSVQYFGFGGRSRVHFKLQETAVSRTQRVSGECSLNGYAQVHDVGVGYMYLDDGCILMSSAKGIPTPYWLCMARLCRKVRLATTSLHVL